MTSPHPSRRLAAIWFADIVGFTGISAANERTAMSLVSLLQLCARRAVGRNGGRLVKFIGDEAMAEFGGTDAAVLAALELRSDFTGLSTKRSIPALLRIGVHLGDVVSAEGDIYGDGVNMTSRIEREAQPGEILVSEEVWRQLRKRPEFVMEDRGEHQLRGLEGPHRLYAVALLEEPEEAQLPAEPTLPDSWAVAVLPFVDISPAHDNEYFSDGVTEELIHSLSRVEGLRVASRTSSYAFKGRNASIDEIAEALRVNIILEGSVRKVGNRVRITPLLVDATNGYQLWTESYEREIEDVLDLQETISTAIVDALQIKLGAPVHREHTRDTVAYDEYLKGRYHWNRHSPADLKKSIEHYERAIAADSGYALAWTGLADSYCTMGGLFLAKPADVYPRAREAARKAIEIDPRLAPAHAALAEVQLRYEWDWEAAERGFRRAVALDPEYADARAKHANLLRDMGRFDEAIVEVRRAQGGDSLSLPISAAVAGVFYHARRYDEAIAECKRALERAPHFYQASYYLGVSHLMKGTPEEAVRHFQRVHEMASTPVSIAALIVAYASVGRREEALLLLEDLLQMAEKGQAFAHPVASAYVALDDREEAFRWFDRAVEERTSWLTSLRVEPRFDHLHGDPRFRRLLERVGLAPKEQRTKHNLPAQQTSILARERELEEVNKLLLDPSVRLVTLAGPGGVGKTRLALESASRGLTLFPDGVWLVALSAVDHPELLLSAIARTLGLRETGPDPHDALVMELRDSRTLLVLDGFEHLLQAASVLADLLAALPELRVVVTSQAVLRVRGERVVMVQPLGLPETVHYDWNAGQLEAYGAVALFLDRMEAVRPAYRPGPTDLNAIVEICRKLDGLPLAIELAAARLRLMPPPALLGRLENRFAFLVEGPRDLPLRHQTLEAVCNWSYGLLDPREQATFRNLAPFAGGCSLEAAEWMERGRFEESDVFEGIDRREVLDLLASLVEKSLLRQVETGEGEPRFQMLETIRQYGLRLSESLNESATVRGRQLDYLLDLATRAEPFLMGPSQAEWLDRLERDYENVVAVMDWGLEAGQVEKAVRVGSAIWWFFWLRGHFGEMRKRLDLALLRGGELPRSLHANLYVASGAMATMDGETDLASKQYEKAIALERERQDPRGMPRALRGFASALANLGQYEAAIPFYEEALALDRGFGNQAGESAALRGMGKMALSRGDLERAQDHFDEALVIARSLGEPQHTAYALARLGDVARERGQLEEAARLYDEGLGHCREVGSRPGVVSALQNLALTAVASNDVKAAERLFRDALEFTRPMGDRSRLALSISGLGRVCFDKGEEERGARLLGAGQALAGSSAWSASRPGDIGRWVAVAKGALGEEKVKRLMEEGQSLSLSDAIDMALGQSGTE